MDKTVRFSLPILPTNNISSAEQRYQLLLTKMFGPFFLNRTRQGHIYGHVYSDDEIT